jgi:apolipoprotein N-acyltransferase
VRKISTAIGAFAEAAAPSVIRSGALAIGTAICYETIYPSVARQEATDGANLLVTISNDSWYGRGGAQEQHFAGAVLRSVENERYLVRAAITGISGVVDARGRIVVETRPNERRSCGPASGSRPAHRLEPWGFRIPGVADVLAGAVLVFALVRWVRSPRWSGAATAGKITMTERDDCSAPEDRLGRLTALRGYL